MPKQTQDIDTARLCEAMHRSRLIHRYYREERVNMVKQFAGRHYSENASNEKVPVNLIALYVSVVIRNLVAKNPRVMLSTFDRGNKPLVSTEQSWANKRITQMNLASVLQRAAMDALFGTGIIKVALTSPDEAARYSFQMGAGQPFARCIDFDDWVADMQARDWEEEAYEGHRYRAPLDAIKDAKYFDPSVTKYLTPTDNKLYNEQGDERIDVMGRGTYGYTAEFEDMVDLWEVYLPRRRLIVTLADSYLEGPTESGIPSKPLRVQRWLGRRTGPYHHLVYGRVPGNLLGKGPIQDLVDLHDAVNRLYRKLIRQAERQKTNTFVQNATEDAGRVRDANDGDIIPVDNPDRIAEVSSGGPNNQNLLIAEHLKDLFDFMAGNLSILGGLAPQSKTLGQDKMLDQNSSRLITDMQDTTITFVSEVLTSLCWYWHHDPFMMMKTEHQIQGLPELSIMRKASPADRRKVAFEDLNLSVDPYSMQHQTPQTRLAALNQVIQTMVLPMMQLLQQQGITVDFNALLKKVAEYMDMPDLADIITIQEPPSQDDPSPAPQGPVQPAQTERTYTRRSVGADTQPNREAEMINAMTAAGGASTNGQAK